MQGTEKPDRELLDALGLCGALVREGSVYRFLAEHRLRLFGDGLFADLWLFAFEVGVEVVGVRG